MDTAAPVVVAIDGSPHSAETLRWGVDEAALRGADVLVARAYQEPQELTAWGWYPYLPGDVPLDAEARDSLASRGPSERERHPYLHIEGRPGARPHRAPRCARSAPRPSCS